MNDNLHESLIDQQQEGATARLRDPARDPVSQDSAVDEQLGRVSIDSAVALRNRDRRVFGTASWLEDRRIAFFSYGELLVGERLELRIELTQAYDSAFGEVVVLEGRREGGGPTFYVAELAFLPEAERHKLFHWARDRARASQSMASQVSEVSADGDPSSVTDNSKGGRSAIREALRKGLAKRQERMSLLAPPPAPRSPILIGAEDGLPYDDLKIEPLTEEEMRPRAEISLSRDGATLMAEWSSWAELSLDWEISLSQGRFIAPLPAPHPPGGYALTLRMTFPDGTILPVPAEASHSVENMLVLNIRFPEAALRRLRRAAAVT